jgi:integrase
MSGEGHHSEYLTKQKNLCREELPETAAQTALRIIDKGITDEGWADSTARNYLRAYRFFYENANKMPRVPDDMVEWNAVDWNEVIDETASNRGVGAGEKEKYAYAAKAFIKLHNRVEDVDKGDINVPDRDRESEKKTEEEVLLEDDIITLIEATVSNRNAAIIALGYQAALRRDALVNLRIKDYKNPEEGMTHIRIPSDADYKGASGSVIPITWAGGYVDNWLSEHPKSDDPDAPLFCSIRNQDRGEALSGHSVYTMMKRLAKHVDSIEDEKIHPHMLRHARASTMRLSEDYDLSDIETVMQWTQSTPMHSTYESLDNQSEAERVAMKMGQDIPEQDAVREIECPRCKQTLNASATYCSSCNLRIEDKVQEWWTLYRKVAPEDDPIREKYEGLPTAVPVVEQLPLAELDRVYDVLMEAEWSTHYDKEPADPIGTDTFDSQKEADDAFQMVIDRMKDTYAQKYADDPMRFRLAEEMSDGDTTAAGYSVDQLEELAKERDLL